MEFIFSDLATTTVNFFFKEDVDHPYFKAKVGEVFPQLNEGKIQLGLGAKEKFSFETLQKAVFKLGKTLYNRSITSLSFETSTLDLTDEDYVLGIAEALFQSAYRFDYYKDKARGSSLQEVIFPGRYQGLADSLAELERVLHAQSFTRDLVNIRNNEMSPIRIAEEAVAALADLGVTLSVYDEEEIRELGLTAFLDVAKGSDNPPRFVVMEYFNGGDQKPLVYVGKGVAYDSGGYTIKSRSGMKTMYCDMAGAATVIGAVQAIAANQLKTNVVGVVGLLENMISGGAYRPGDILTARNGMKIDVDNTDAEGRILLADAVNYASDLYEPEMLVDLATLTGAVVSALGETYTGAVTNDEDALDRVQKAAKRSHEKIWALPNDDFYRSYIKSDVADIVNSGGSYAGTITAAQFIEAFLEEGTPWVHLDIAGTAYLSAPQSLYGKGATGVHVQTLYQLAKDHQN